MAKQIAWLCNPLIGTYDEITCYELAGEYYARKKSSLTGKRVKTSPEFKRTMIYANLLVRASRIGAQIYKALPPGWRQFWMYRSFTGEAFTLLEENPYDDEEVKQLLWKCYVEYWEQRKAVDPDNPIFQPKPKKIRKRRKYSEESIQRMLKRKGKDGKPKWIDPEEEERKRLHKEMNAACYARTMEKQRKQAEQATDPKEPVPAAPFQPVNLLPHQPVNQTSILHTSHRQPIRKILRVPSYIRKNIKKTLAPREQFKATSRAPPVTVTAQRMKTSVFTKAVAARQRRKATGPTAIETNALPVAVAFHNLHLF